MGLFTEYFLRLVCLCLFSELGVLFPILWLSQYGPFAVYGFIASIIAIMVFLNNARSHGNSEWIVEGVSRQRREDAIERFVEEVKARREQSGR